jgi:hypothetical protein
MIIIGIFVLFVSGFVAGRLYERIRIVKIINNEPNFPGAMPMSLKMILDDKGVEEICRLVGKCVKKALIRKIYNLEPEKAPSLELP